MGAEYSIDMKKALDDLLQGPKFPNREFVQGTTFGEIYAMAAHLRAVLGERQPGQAVCLAAGSKAVMAAALLAALAGGPPLLLPYAFSAGALAQLQQATGFTTAIADTARDFPEDILVIRPQVPEVEERAEAVQMPVSPAASPGTELLKIFTGGSTGTPQLWSKTAANLFGEGFFLAECFEVTNEDCILATIPPYHIYGLLFSVILPLVSSATVVAATPSFPGEIVEAAEEHEVTILASVPVHYRVLRDRKISEENALRLAFSSAGMLDADDNLAFSKTNGIGVVEVYGSTETGGIATRNRALGEDFFTPFPTIAWKVAGDRLAVRSPYISPDLPVDGEGYFIAGDRVEARGAQFSLQGRADSVTKVGGKRVDLEEIGQLIKGEAGVTDCVVMALPETGGREHRIGALIQGDAADLEGIRKKLSETLEPYALPRRLKKVERLPMTQNGKYDWAAIVQLLEE